MFQIKFILVGSGPKRKTLRLLSREKLSFAGPRSLFLPFLPGAGLLYLLLVLLLAAVQLLLEWSLWYLVFGPNYYVCWVLGCDEYIWLPPLFPWKRSPCMFVKALKDASNTLTIRVAALFNDFEAFHKILCLYKQLRKCWFINISLRTQEKM